MPVNDPTSRDGWKTEISSDSIFKNRTVQKFDIHSESFLIKIACSSYSYKK